MDAFVSDIDYSEAQNILNLTTIKQKQKRSHNLAKQLLLKRTYTHVCQLLESECTIKKSFPLATIDTNKRKLSPIDDYQVLKKSKNSMDEDILQFLRELNSVKIVNRY